MADARILSVLARKASAAALVVSAIGIGCRRAVKARYASSPALEEDMARVR